MRIGELAASAGISVDTVRHYERSGLLPAAERTPGGYREFPPAAFERLRMVRAALAVGFSVAELARILAERDKGGAPCRSVRALAGEKLAEIERQERELAEVRRALVALLAEWDARLGSRPAGARAHLLEQLSERTEEPTPVPRRRLRRTRKEKQ